MKTLMIVLTAFVLVSCSTYSAIQMLANASHTNSGSEPAPQAAPSAAAAPAPPAPAPAANQAGSQAPAGLDAAAKAEWTRYAQPTPSGKTFGAGADLSASTPTTLKAGEWAVYRSLENGQVKGVIKLALVGKDADAWIYEFVSYSEKEVAVVQEAIKGLDDLVQTGDSSKGQVVWIKVKGKDGKIQTLDGAMLGMAGSAYKGMITGTAARPSSAITAGGPITVPAGTFTATWRADTQVAQGRGSSESGTAWISTQVPLWHLIKAQGKSGHVLELVDFGTTGYQSSLN